MAGEQAVHLSGPASSAPRAKGPLPRTTMTVRPTPIIVRHRRRKRPSRGYGAQARMPVGSRPPERAARVRARARDASIEEGCRQRAQWRLSLRRERRPAMRLECRAPSRAVRAATRASRVNRAPPPRALAIACRLTRAIASPSPSTGERRRAARDARADIASPPLERRRRQHAALQVKPQRTRRDPDERSKLTERPPRLE